MDGQNFYAPPQADLQGSQSGQEYGYGAMVLASRLSRLGAVCLNSLILGVASAPVIMAVVLSDSGAMNSTDAGYMMILMIVISAVSYLGFLGFNLYYLAKDGQSIGKKLVGIKIVRSDLRTPATLGRLVFARWFPIYAIQLIPCLGDLLYLANFLMIFGAEQKCGHDHIADTHVVRADVSYDDLMEEEDNYSDVAW